MKKNTILLLSVLSIIVFYFCKPVVNLADEETEKEKENNTYNSEEEFKDEVKNKLKEIGFTDKAIGVLLSKNDTSDKKAFFTKMGIKPLDVSESTHEPLKKARIEHAYKEAINPGKVDLGKHKFHDIALDQYFCRALYGNGKAGNDLRLTTDPNKDVPSVSATTKTKDLPYIISYIQYTGTDPLKYYEIKKLTNPHTTSKLVNNIIKSFSDKVTEAVIAAVDGSSGENKLFELLTDISRNKYLKNGSDSIKTEDAEIFKNLKNNLTAFKSLSGEYILKHIGNPSPPFDEAKHSHLYNNTIKTIIDKGW